MEPTWRKSSYSSDQSGNCGEVADLPDGGLASGTPRIRPARLDVHRGRIARVHECASISFTDPVTRNGPTLVHQGGAVPPSLPTFLYDSQPIPSLLPSRS